MLPLNATTVRQATVKTAGYLLPLVVIASSGCSTWKMPSLAPHFPGVSQETSIPKQAASTLLLGRGMGAGNEQEYQTPDGTRLQGDVSPTLPGAPTSMMEKVYYSTREAKARGGIVLQVVGDESPVRVLPLPSDGTPVYVSQLVRQSGLQKRLKSLDLTLFRYATGTVEGIPMECKVNRASENVRPESDYALHPGDRLRAREAAMDLGDIVDRILMR